MVFRNALSRRSRLALVALAAVLLLGFIVPCTAQEGFQSWGWALTSESQPDRRTNVILFIGDGMGLCHVQAGRLAAAALGRTFAMDTMPVRSKVSTLSHNQSVTDSAAAATALSTGHKTINRSLGVDSELRPVTTIVEAVRDNGGLTGLVTNSAITGGTPAGFAVHVMDRGSSRDIARELVKTRPSLMMGGGDSHFAPTLFERKKPGIELAAQAGYAVVRTIDEMKSANALPLLGLFSPIDLEFEMDRDPASQPSLAQMTAKAIELLSANAGDRGFFLMVENDLIDVSSHDNNARRMPAEVAALDEAVGVGLEFARQNGDTLVIVTADHETGMVEISPDGQITFGSDGHSSREAPLFAEGPGQERLALELLDNTQIATIMADVMGVTVGELIEPEGEGGEAGAAEAAEATPAAPAAPQRAQLTGYAPKRITAMTYNIHIGVGMDFEYNLDRIVQLIKDEGADVIGLNEVDYETTRSRGINQAKYIAEKLGFYYAEGKIFRTSGGYFGNAVVSRYPIVSSENHILPNPMGNELRAALECQIDIDGAILNFFSTHLDVRDADSRTAQAVQLAQLASKLRGPTIIAGDFNAVPLLSTETAAIMKQFNDTWQVYRVLVDSAEIARESVFTRDYAKGGNTIDAVSPNRRIDYVFASHDLIVRPEVGAARVPSTMASDHLPYLVDFEMPWAGGQQKQDKALIAVLDNPESEQWFNEMRWTDGHDIDEIFGVIGSMGYECVEVGPANARELPYAAASRPTVLLIPNLRRIDYRTQQAVREFVHSGGRVLATSQSSLKTPDEQLSGAFGFGLADVFGVEFAGWLGVTPLHDAIAHISAGEAIWADVPNPLVLEPEDRQGVIVRARAGAQVLGVWSDSEGLITHPSVVGPAVVLNGRSIYVASDVLSWHALQNESARTFLANAIACLLSK